MVFFFSLFSLRSLNSPYLNAWGFFSLSPFCFSPPSHWGEVSKKLGRGLVSSQGQPSAVGYSDNHHNIKLRKWLGLQQEVASPCPSLKQDAPEQWIKYIMPQRNTGSGFLMCSKPLRTGSWELLLPSLFERQGLPCPNSASCSEGVWASSSSLQKAAGSTFWFCAKKYFPAPSGTLLLAKVGETTKQLD